MLWSHLPNMSSLPQPVTTAECALHPTPHQQAGSTQSHTDTQLQVHDLVFMCVAYMVASPSRCHLSEACARGVMLHHAPKTTGLRLSLEIPMTQATKIALQCHDTHDT